MAFPGDQWPARGVDNLEQSHGPVTPAINPQEMPWTSVVTVILINMGRKSSISTFYLNICFILRMLILHKMSSTGVTKEFL